MVESLLQKVLWTAISITNKWKWFVAPSGMFFNARYSKFHMGNFTEEKFKDIFNSQRYKTIMDCLASQILMHKP